MICVIGRAKGEYFSRKLSTKISGIFPETRILDIVDLGRNIRLIGFYIRLFKRPKTSLVSRERAGQEEWIAYGHLANA
jgi:hypothetical protein